MQMSICGNGAERLGSRRMGQTKTGASPVVENGDSNTEKWALRERPIIRTDLQIRTILGVGGCVSTNPNKSVQNIGQSLRYYIVACHLP